MSRKYSNFIAFFAVMVLVSLTVGIVSAAPVTQSISYQGKLTDTAGNPLTGPLNIWFRLYSSFSGGSPLASNYQSQVQAINGLFTTPVTFDSSFFDGQALWLGVTVGNDAEMTPRQEIRPVPYALGLRPGAIISGSGMKTGLTLINSGNSIIGLNATSTGPNSIGVYANAPDNGSNGIQATSSGDGAIGIAAYASGTDSTAIWADYTGRHGKALSALASGDGSTGAAITTTGDHSLAVSGATSAPNSTAIYGEATGFNSNAIVGVATKDSSWAGNFYSAGVGSAGVHVDTTGVASPGILAYTHNDGSQAVYGNSEKDVGVYGVGKEGGYFTSNQAGTSFFDQRPGVNVSTANPYNPGVQIRTTGLTSYGVHAVATGQNSDGVLVETRGQYSDGVAAFTSGYGSAAIAARAYGQYSQGVYAFSEQARALEGDTNNTNHEWGVYTDDYIYAGGIRAPDVDVAEFMPVLGNVTPGTVLVIGPEGKLQVSTIANDTRVAGIISTSPAIALGTKSEGNSGEAIVAVAGRVPCKVDAANAPIHAGDLLTTSDNPGYAMKATKPQIGTVLGKAMGSLESGTGTIEVLVTLQ